MSESSPVTSPSPTRRGSGLAGSKVAVQVAREGTPLAPNLTPSAAAPGRTARGPLRSGAHTASRDGTHGAASRTEHGASRDGAHGAASAVKHGAAGDVAQAAPRAMLRLAPARHSAAQAGAGVVAPHMPARPAVARACVLATPGSQGGAPRHGARRPAAATPREAVLDAQAVLYRLEEAGRALLALPNTGYTTRLRLNAIEFVRSALTGEGWETTRADAPGKLRPAVPDSARITRMDEALGWIGLIPHDRYVLRRIVGCRALVSPSTERHLFPWRRIGLLIGADHKAVQRWHAQGIDLIVAALADRR